MKSFLISLNFRSANVCFTFALLMNFFFSSSISNAQDVAALNAANKSVTYDQVISKYKLLDEKFAQAKLLEMGMTDIGRPLHLFVISSDEQFSPEQAKKSGKLVFLINNAIHPGEPDGVDACIRYSERILADKKALPSNVVILVIPFYNIDGAMKRGCCSRANQNGPEAYGFRGNARNLDLNRDFIKCDSENAKSFTALFRAWDPDVFLDTHVSDGSDYQYTMTLISTQHNKLGGPAGKFMKTTFTPALFEKMKAAGDEMAPYVNTARYDDTPENGIYGFLENPRFASGYAALFNCFAFVSETHMLKPFDARVKSTLRLIDIMVKYSSENAGTIQEKRKQTNAYFKSLKEHVLGWESDTTIYDTIMFKGYESYRSKSKVTGTDQLYFDQTRPYTRSIKLYDEYKPTESVTVPAYYIIPQAWKSVIERMILNKVELIRFSSDTSLMVEQYIIKDFKTGKDPYEGHYMHSNVQTEKRTIRMNYFKGDYLIPTNQDAIRYIVETCEPTAPDSWFAWGFFDSILQQKEWFSSYVFDEMAASILEKNPGLKKELETKRAADKDFAENGFAQLYFIYKNSAWFEDFRVFPIARFRGAGQKK
ncbi:MAG: hypothetical protein IPN54_11795 [Bacteroidetes bacterium]|nr:hypothetical protein [Bacteroidota bacterium]